MTKVNFTIKFNLPSFSVTFNQIEATVFSLYLTDTHMHTKSYTSQFNCQNKDYSEQISDEYRLLKFWAEIYY